MADLFISIFAYLIVLCSVCIYVRRRKYKLKYKMIGVMFRLAVLFVVFHLFNALIGFSEWSNFSCGMIEFCFRSIHFK